MSNTTLLPAHPGAPRLARDVIRQLCIEAGLDPGDTETAVLLTSELVANAVLHTGGPAMLTASLRPGRLRVFVADGSTSPPRAVPAPPPTSGSGRGLLLVSELADRWGHTPTRTGKTVWFELALA
jgi:anti-sigma regulatory factor (Ser/Thr protein kinase)